MSLKLAQVQDHLPPPWLFQLGHRGKSRHTNPTPDSNISHTTNQVSTLLISLRRSNFAFIEVCEILLRYYKAVADRLRPTDRMIAHTGYLIFSRSMVTEISNLNITDHLSDPSDLPSES